MSKVKLHKDTEGENAFVDMICNRKAQRNDAYRSVRSENASVSF